MRRYATVLIIVMVLVPGNLLVGGPVSIAAQDTSPATPAVELPETPVGDQLAWLLALLSGDGESPTEEDIAARFTPAALAATPPALIIGVAQQFAAALGPFTYLGPARHATNHQIVGYIAGREGASFLLVLATEPASPYRLTGVGLLPSPPPAELPPLAPETLGGLFDVGGRLISLSCSGSGSPTVILEAGYGDSGGLWAPVQNGIAPLSRVCSYDRPNVSAGASDPAPTPRSAADQVADLHALLAAADVPGPYVMAAHSYGGLIARLFAATYPDDVVGLVLIDTVHEDRAEQREAMVSPELWEALQEVESQFSDFERLDQEASWTQVREAQRVTPLRPMPLVVLAAGQPIDPSFLPPGWPLAEEEQLRRRQQGQLAELVPDGKYVLVEESGHYIQLEQPNLVIDAIAEVVETARTPGAWSTPPDGEPTSTPVAISHEATPPPTGDRVDIGGRALFLSCTGTGSPTVVLEAGGGNPAATWEGLQPEIANVTRVCSYDRAGLGKSDPAPPGVRTVQDSVDDLHALLGAADIAGPYVLVGHSLGGLIMRLYASQHPDDVAGLVLVDGMPPDLLAYGLALQPAEQREQTFTIMRGIHPQDPEHLDVIASGVWVMAHPPSLVPTVVLAAGFHGGPGSPPDPIFEELWQKLQREQARLLAAHFISVPDADHFLHLDRPDLVLEAIHRMVEAVRGPGTWSTPTPE